MPQLFDINGVALPPMGGLQPAMGPSKIDQILYNPVKSSGIDTTKSSNLKIRNIAAPGSLLKVWEGALDVGASLQ